MVARLAASKAAFHQLLHCSCSADHRAAGGWLRPSVHCLRSRQAGSRPARGLVPAVTKRSSAGYTTGPVAAAVGGPLSAGEQATPYYVGKIKRSLSSSSSSDSGDSSRDVATSSSGSRGGSAASAINKEPISSSMSPALYQYLLAHTREHPLLAELRQETAQMHGAQMQIAPEQGQLLAVLVELLGVQRAIEVGVFTGYSSLAVALALPPSGQLFAFDRDAKTLAVAQRYWEAAGVAGRVTARLGPALSGLQQLLEEEGEASFDMAFIDADKRGYQDYFELCLRLVRPGGLVALDNVLFYGKVANPAAADKASLALKRFNDDLMADERVSFSIVPIGDGMALCRKR